MILTCENSYHKDGVQKGKQKRNIESANVLKLSHTLVICALAIRVLLLLQLNFMTEHAVWSLTNGFSIMFTEEDILWLLYM